MNPSICYSTTPLLWREKLTRRFSALTRYAFLFPPALISALGNERAVQCTDIAIVAHPNDIRLCLRERGGRDV